MYFILNRFFGEFSFSFSSQNTKSNTFNKYFGFCNMDSFYYWLNMADFEQAENVWAC